jgi:hypothetical protein
VTDATWERIIQLFESNERRLAEMPSSEPVSRVTYWRESPHRTLGHLTACQAAWLPIMRQLLEGAEKGSVPIRPDPLFTKLGLAAWAWEQLLERYRQDRAEWGSILHEVDPAREIQGASRVLTTRTLTKRLVDHERSHLDQLGRVR